MFGKIIHCHLYDRGNVSLSLLHAPFNALTLDRNNDELYSVRYDNESLICLSILC